jgi:hypothetical protein
LSRAPRAAVLLALAAALCACGDGASEWIGKLQAEPLYKRAETLRSSPACAAVPVEFGRTLPVPRRASGFSALFYPLQIAPSKSEALTPQYRVDFEADAAARPDRCAKIGSGAPASLGPAVPPGVSNKEYYRAAARVYAALPRVAELYRGGAAAPADRDALAGFYDAFSEIAEPGLGPNYYALNPDFWEWLRKAGGRSLARPS